jgi:hypothetical protein
VPERAIEPPFNCQCPTDGPIVYCTVGETCPGCDAAPALVRGEWETVHDDDCDWFHGPDRLVPDAE